MKKIKLLILFVCFYTYSNAQKVRSVVNGYGHMNYNLLSDLNSSNDPTKSYFELGEHDLFVNSYFNDRISFLG